MQLLRNFAIWICTFLLFAAITYASSFQIAGPNDRLELNETAGDVIATLTSNEITELAAGSIATSQGTTGYTQSLKLQDNSSAFQSFKTIYGQSESNQVGDFVFIDGGNSPGNAFASYSLSFSEGLKSEVDGDSLKDFIGKKITLFGEEFTFVKAERKSTDIKLELLSGAVLNLMKEGEKTQFTLGGKTYTVEATSVETTSDKKVQLTIDGKPQSDMDVGETTILTDGTVLGVTKILSASSGQADMVEVALGGKSVEFHDSDLTDTNYQQGIIINKKSYTDAHISISGSISGTIVTLNSLNYRFTTSQDVYLAPSDKISQRMENPESLLWNWDIVYNGLDTSSSNNIVISSQDDSDYSLQFVNQDGNSYTIPLASAASSFKLGTSTSDLIIVESGATTTSNVDLNDYFVLTTSNDKTGKTYVMRYTSLTNSTSTITFDNVAGGTKSIVYTNGSGTIQGEATLSVGSINAKVYILSTGSLSVDLNGDGDVLDNTAGVDVITAGGGILDMGNTNAITSPYSMSLTTQGSQFDESTSDETISWQISSSGKNIQLQLSSISGVSTYSTSSNHWKGMTKYGILVDLYDLGGADAETLTLEYPTKQVFSKISVESGPPKIGPGTATTIETTCNNGVQDGDETGVDCGGSCNACTAAASCSDGIQNQNEEGIDCGGPCSACAQKPAQSGELICSGCWHISEDKKTCLLLGDTIGNLYCAADKTLKPKKSNGELCAQAYECAIGICEQGKCGRHITPFVLIMNLSVLVLLVGILYYLVTIVQNR